MKKIIILMLFTLVVLTALALILQLLPIPDSVYIITFVILVASAAFIYQRYEAVIQREAQGKQSEAKIELKKIITVWLCNTDLFMNSFTSERKVKVFTKNKQYIQRLTVNGVIYFIDDNDQVHHVDGEWLKYFTKVL